ncbi:MAG: diguanylate cyclase [Coriobacteriia bacterium]|nr:diguanylate cyclase [Coriobacteriia bacterium]
MNEVLERCVELDTAAQQSYARLAEACTDPELSLTFQRMSAEESTHVQWWSDLCDAYADGRVPAIADEATLLASVNEVAEQVRELLEGDITSLSPDEMLELAIRMEFFMLDPAFGELIDLLDPGADDHHRDAYSRHVMRLVHEVENRYSARGLASFLARVLARTYRDQERLTALATRDTLTGIYNRRGFYNYLTQWCSWSERYRHSLGVLLIDVDHFKNVNDTLGHPAGDAALCAVADAICDSVRTSDLVGRYGGDEFAVIAPETSAQALEILAQRILEGVRNAKVEIDGASVELTVSVGGAYVSSGQVATAETLLSCADKSLYRAKDAGRDCAGAVIDISAPTL